MRTLLAIALASVLGLSACSLGGDGSETAGSPTTSVRVAATDTSQGGGSVFGRIPTIVTDVQPSVVAVMVDNGEGSGVIFASDGTIVTNNHVVEGTQSVRVVFATGETVSARVVARDPLSDLAVLKVDRGGLPAATFATAAPQVGELAVALGSPLGFENTVTAGIVSGLNRAVPAGGQEGFALTDLIQTDAAISPGNSGGALVNADGDVIGINVAFIPPQARAVSIGFAIPASTVVAVVKQLLETGEVQHAFLGVRTTDLTPELAERFGIDAESGLFVIAVVPESGAAAAGLRPGDVILSVDGKAMHGVEDLFSLLRNHKPGDDLQIEILRDGDRQTLTATLTNRPS